MCRNLLIILFLLFTVNAYATPNNSMSISPAAVDQTTITAADENARNSEISTKYNAHSHTDISQTANTLNVGDAAAGDKTITAYNADANKPFLKYDDTNDRWIMSVNGSTNSVAVSIHGNAISIHGSAAKLYIQQPDNGCSKCGVDNAGTTWSCEDIPCQQ